MAVGESRPPQAAPPAPTMRALPQPEEGAVILPARFEALVGFLSEQREGMLAAHLHQDVRLISYEPGRLIFHPAPGLDPNFALHLGQKLTELTRHRWSVVASADEDGAPTLRQQAEETERRRAAEAAQTPLVRAVIETFPGATITRVRMTQPAPAPADADWTNGEPDE
jgi:DNA polymerase-3 subunit gamma/tau